AVGVSPHRYLTTRRIEIAKHLLERTRFSIAEIALETGFSSQAHFTHRFREQVELTPRQYRQGGGRKARPRGGAPPWRLEQANGPSEVLPMQLPIRESPMKVAADGDFQNWSSQKTP